MHIAEVRKTSIPHDTSLHDRFDFTISKVHQHASKGFRTDGCSENVLPASERWKRAALWPFMSESSPPPRNKTGTAGRDVA